MKWTELNEKVFKIILVFNKIVLNFAQFIVACKMSDVFLKDSQVVCAALTFFALYELMKLMEKLESFKAVSFYFFIWQRISVLWQTFGTSNLRIAVLHLWLWMTCYLFLSYSFIFFYSFFLEMILVWILKSIHFMWIHFYLQ